MSEKGTKYYAYMKTTNAEIRLTGVRADENLIELKAKTGEIVRLVYAPEKDSWRGTITTPGGTFDVVAKVRETKSGEPYLYAWNPDGDGYKPNVAIFRAGYRRGESA